MCGSGSPNDDKAASPVSVPVVRPKTNVKDSKGNVVTDSSGKAVTSKPISNDGPEKHEREEEKIAEEENLTEEEAEEEGKIGRSATITDKRKSRLTINRVNPSLSVGTKKYRTALNIPK